MKANTDVVICWPQQAIIRVFLAIPSGLQIATDLININEVD